MFHSGRTRYYRTRWHRAPLEEFSRMFLDEVSTANRSFLRSQLAMAAELTDAAQRGQWARSLGAPESTEGSLAEALQAQAAMASRLAIVEATMTLWLEPVGPSLWQWLCSVFSCQLREKAQTQLYRLAPARRRSHALRYEVKIGPRSQEPLQASSQPAIAGSAPALGVAASGVGNPPELPT
jgi:hypothetical protein